MKNEKETMENSLYAMAPLANNHISVDCVVIGFDGQQLKVLLIRRTDGSGDKMLHDMKLPGSLIYQDEDLDEAAKRVLFELTGLKNMTLTQFKAYGSKDRTKNPEDVCWLERSMQAKINRIVTIAYLSFVKINRTLNGQQEGRQNCWVNVSEVGPLAFDHNRIICEAMDYIRHYVETNPASLFDLLPRKFTASQFHALYECVYEKKIDVRNFYKKMALMKYVLPLEERQQGVAHRTARYFCFDKTIYNKVRR